MAYGNPSLLALDSLLDQGVEEICLLPLSTVCDGHGRLVYRLATKTLKAA